jgi:hypothetical protein
MSNFVAMDDEVALAVRRLVHIALAHLDAAEMHAEKLAQEARRDCRAYR